MKIVIAVVVISALAILNVIVIVALMAVGVMALHGLAGRCDPTLTLRVRARVAPEE